MKLKDAYSLEGKLMTNLSSVQFSRSVVSDSLRPHESLHARPPCSSPSPGVHSHSCPSSPWCHPAISSSVVPFSSCPQSLPVSESFPMSQLFSWGGWMAWWTRWTWVWVNSGRWWWTGRPGVLRFMGLQRVGHDWVTELNLTKRCVEGVRNRRKHFPNNFMKLILSWYQNQMTVTQQKWKLQTNISHENRSKTPKH